MAALDPQQIKQKLNTIPGWELDGDRIRREFKFKSFIEAFGWMSSVALVAQGMDHHPEWTNIYNRVRVELTTHDAKGITDKDFRLAGKMNELHGT